MTGPSSLHNYPEFLYLTFAPFKSTPTRPCFAGPESLSIPGFFSVSFLTFLSALCAWVLPSHTLWLQLHSPVSPLTKCPQGTAVINCLPRLAQGSLLWGQTPYWTWTRQKRTSTPPWVSVLKTKWGLLQKGSSVHQSKNENIWEVLLIVKEFWMAQTIKRKCS